MGGGPVHPGTGRGLLGLRRDEQSCVEAFGLQQGLGLGRETAGECLGAGRVGTLGVGVGGRSLVDGVHAEHERDDEDHGRGDEETTESSVLAGLRGYALSVGAVFAFGELVARGEELALAGAEGDALGDVVGRGEAGPAVQDRLVVVGVVPLVCGLGDEAAHADGVAVFVDPFGRGAAIRAGVLRARLRWWVRG